MLILLPPSETKRTGGARGALNIEQLALPELLPQREQVVDALVRLSDDQATAARVLKLGPSLLDSVADNARLRTSRTMPAMDRYTGVLYDALDAPSLDRSARAWLGRNVYIHSAPLGPVAASDPIPTYRLGAGVSLPLLPSLKRVWAEAVTAALAGHGGPILDLRSEAYVALGPIPDSVQGAYVRVATETADGQTRALNHFNKHAKGELVRRLALERPRLQSIDGFVRWAQGAEINVRRDESGALTLVV